MATSADKPRLDPATLRDLTREGEGPRLLDVRTPGEFRTAHIPGSSHVPLDTLREHRGELLHHLDEDVIRICRSGTRTVPYTPPGMHVVVDARGPRPEPAKEPEPDGDSRT